MHNVESTDLSDLSSDDVSADGASSYSMSNDDDVLDDEDETLTETDYSKYKSVDADLLKWSNRLELESIDLKSQAKELIQSLKDAVGKINKNTTQCKCTKLHQSLERLEAQQAATNRRLDTIETSVQQAVTAAIEQCSKKDVISQSQGKLQSRETQPLQQDVDGNFNNSFQYYASRSSSEEPEFVRPIIKKSRPTSQKQLGKPLTKATKASATPSSPISCNVDTKFTPTNRKRERQETETFQDASNPSNPVVDQDILYEQHVIELFSGSQTKPNMNTVRRRTLL